MIKEFQINIVSWIFLTIRQFWGNKIEQELWREIVKAIEISYGNMVELLVLMFKNQNSIWTTKYFIMELWHIYSLFLEYEKRFLRWKKTYTEQISWQFDNLKKVRNSIAHIDERIWEVIDALSKGKITKENKKTSKKNILYSDPDKRSNVIVAGRMINIIGSSPSFLISFWWFIGDDFVITDKQGNDCQLLRIDIQNKKKLLKIKKIVQDFFDSLQFDNDWKSNIPEDVQ